MSTSKIQLDSLYAILPLKDTWTRLTTTTLLHSTSVLLLIICLAGLVFRNLSYKRRQSRKPSKTSVAQSDQQHPNGYPAIEPRDSFDWNSTEPLKFRAFKPKYHLTMALERATISELLEIDRNYAARVTLRRRIMQEHQGTVLAAEPEVGPAVREMYSFVLGTYLPQRYPSMFELSDEDVLHNKALDEFTSAQPPSSSLECLRILGGICDDEFLFLLPSADGDGYTLKGFVTCFPSGFDTAKKLNLKLRDIHKPVPGYKEKLEKSMDRYFDKLVVGNCVRRSNWTITTTDALFVPHGNHLHSGEQVTEEQVDPRAARLRCERQFLHRLPQSGAIVFSFKTYLYTLDDIKAEGLGVELAEAIDGFKSGSVPDFHYYKKAVVWGTAVKDYLREQ